MKNGSKGPVKGVKPRAREVISPPLVTMVELAVVVLVHIF